MNKKPLFEIIVVATMSSGKSTLINALIGKELLHSANEATTATITRIHDRDDLSDFVGSAYNHRNKLVHEEQLVNPQLLQEWNRDNNLKTIDISGNIKGLKNSQNELVIYDTPGPNNSQDDNHEKLTMDIINDGNYSVILYILNASQLGINDDKYLLEQIKKVLDKDQHKEIIFVLNKIDHIDNESESVATVIDNAESYLSNLGFKEPVIIPTSANAALLFQKAIYGKTLTRKERAELTHYLEYPHSKDINISHAKIAEEFKHSVLSAIKTQKSTETININSQNYFVSGLANAIIYSGIGLLAHYIQFKLDNTHPLQKETKTAHLQQKKSSKRK